MRVEPVGLALVPAPLAQRCLVWRDVTNIAAGSDEELGEGPAESACAFETPPFDGAELGAHVNAVAWPSRLLGK